MIFQGNWLWYWSLSGNCTVRETLLVSKQEAQKLDVERFNLKKLSELQVRKQYKIKISKTSVTLDNLHDSEDIKCAWENIKENIKIGLYEWKQHKPWFDEECLQFLD